MLKFDGCTFSAAGANKSAKVFGLTLNGAEDVSINNCKFDGTGYSGLLNKCEGDVTIKGCAFECDNFRNPIEGGQAAPQGNLIVEDCRFTGAPGNNFINFYNVKEDSVHNIKNCYFEGNMGENNIIRLSNVESTTATYNIDDCVQVYIAGEENEYTGFIICQDYTNRTGKFQDFGNYTVNINNLDRPNKGKLFYVYEDGVGLVDNNDPAIYLDGELVSNPGISVEAPPIMVEEEDEL